MLRFRNKKLISADNLALVKDLAEYILHKFFTARKRAKLEITIVFTKNLYKNTNHYADCIWEDTHYLPTEFTIRVDPNQKLGLILNSVAHELTHVKQWAKGEFYQLLRKPKVYMYNKSRVDTNKIDYWDYPWEIEAHGRGIALVVLWYRDRGLNNTKLLDSS